MSAELPRVTARMHLVCAKSALAVPRIRTVVDLLSRELASTSR